MLQPGHNINLNIFSSSFIQLLSAPGYNSACCAALAWKTILFHTLHIWFVSFGKLSVVVEKNEFNLKAVSESSEEIVNGNRRLSDCMFLIE